MTFTTIGDQAALFLQRRQSAQLKAEMQRLGQELATGRRQRPATPATGDSAHLLEIARTQTRLVAGRAATAEAAFLLDAAQRALGEAGELAGATGSAMLAAASAADPARISGAAAEAATRLAAAVTALNGRAAERALFSGTATGTAPLAGPAAILAALQATVAGETTAAGVQAVVDAWFDTPGGGFESLAYQGDGGTLVLRLGTAGDLALPARADGPEIRAALKGLALAALADAPGLAAAPEQKTLLARAAAEAALAGADRVTTLRAGIGALQARVEEAEVRQAAEATALGLAQAQFTAADPFDTATRLQAAQTQLETLFAVTARQSRLTLTAFLR